MALFKPFDLKYLRDSKPEIASEWEIDLSTARTNEPMIISGDFIHVLDQTGKLQVRLNEITGFQVDVRKVKKVYAPFYRLFLTNAAQTYGKVKLLVGHQASFKFEERRTSHTTILKIDDGTITNVAGSGAHTLDLAGYKNIRIYFDCNKDATVILWTYPENASVIADYTYDDQISLVDTDRKFTRVLDEPIGGIQIGIYNEDSADDMTYDLIVMGEK